MIKNYNCIESALMDASMAPDWVNGMYDTKAIFNINIETSTDKNTIPLNSLRTTPWKTALREFIGYLRGYTTLEEFHSLNCKTWDSNGTNPDWLNNKSYKGEGDLGRIYGAQLRGWAKPNGESLDQLQKLIDDLSTHKDHRGNHVTFWNPGEFDIACLRPCMHSHSFFIDSDGELNLNSFSRSMDGVLGGVANVIQNWFFLYFMSSVTGLPFGTSNILVNNFHVYKGQLQLLKGELQRVTPIDTRAYVKWVGPDLTLDLLMTEDVTKYIEISGYQSKETTKYPFTTTTVR